MGLKRRQFLQRTGLALALVGAGDFSLSLWGNRVAAALAQSTPRKLALLVGINQYRELPLAGCVTDVELQRQLLRHRFGFAAADILTLTDQQATREAIEAAFVSHLIEQAKPGDVVVFHFSGYGSSVGSLTLPEAVQTSLVTADTAAGGEGAVANDLLQDTLLLLLRSLRTDKITTILDTSYTYPGSPLHGNLRIRAYPMLVPEAPSLAELTFQEQLLSRGNFSGDRPGGQWRFSQMPGVVLSAGGLRQLATEVHWNGFTAGLFTYALTHYLWQATAATSLQICLGRVAERVEHLMQQAQQPQLSGQKGQETSLLPFYQVPIPAIGADGVVTAVEDNGKTIHLWLGGLTASLVEQYGAGSLLTLVQEGRSSDQTPPVRVQLINRDGLIARARILSSSSRINPTDKPAASPDSDPAENLPAVRAGQFVREQVRVLPRNIGLTLALDSNLGRIERVDAISALSTLSWVSSAIAGEQAADYLFSRVQEMPTQVAVLPSTSLSGLLGSNPLPTTGGYGLFSPGRDAIPNTIGERGEAVKVAVRRLVPKLQTLLAAKLLNLTVNQDSSRLPVRASLESVTPQPKPLLRRQTLAVSLTATGWGAAGEIAGRVNLPVGEAIQYRLENLASEPLYWLLLHLDTNGDLQGLYSPLTARSTAAEAAEALPSIATITAIAPGQTLTLPQAGSPFQWLVRGATGTVDTYLLCSRQPFQQTFALVIDSLRPTGDGRMLAPLSNPLEVAQAVLQDLHRASPPQGAGSPDTYSLDVNAWASFRFSYQIIG